MILNHKDATDTVLNLYALPANNLLVEPTYLTN